MRILLTDKEISRAAYERNKLFEEDAAFAYTRKPSADECIAKAQLKKVYKMWDAYPKLLINGRDGFSGYDLKATRNFWKALDKECEN